ncbi:receptor-type guanylate cyclase gcy-12-like [Paramacrobiotus metropolitanus]|uniref:receptor-type guanylate cyclase gcy-12-like n=1 Tax=Paramacrobiotus metropolitanus TaxID=2943436 RepID=UPI002445A420|nr:receptor-type guanylate cyclase gcy-12-like [Paramacrobiotus metropolitanus]
MSNALSVSIFVMLLYIYVAHAQRNVTIMVYGMSSAPFLQALAFTAAGFDWGLRDAEQQHPGMFNISLEYITSKKIAVCADFDGHYQLVAEYYYKKCLNNTQVCALFYPGCNPTTTLASLGREWNIFTLNSGTTFSHLHDHTLYPTAIDFAPLQYVPYGAMVLRLLQSYNWTSVAMVYDNSTAKPFNAMVYHEVEKYLRLKGKGIRFYSVVVNSTGLINYDWVVSQISQVARVVLISLPTGTARNLSPSPLVVAAYTSVLLYFQALQETVSADGNIRDGRTVAQALLNRSFSFSPVGKVFLNEYGERQDSVCLANFQSNIRAFENVARYVSAEGKLMFIANRSVDWGSADNLPPRNMPVCGYGNDLCQGFRVAVPLGAFFGVVVIAFVFTGFYIRRMKASYQESDWWHIDLQKLEKPLQHSNFLRRLANTTQNINRLIGISVQPATITFVKSCCQRGGLDTLLDEFLVDNSLKISLIWDVIKGLSYIHRSSIQRHGHLRPSKCLVDKSFIAQITEVGMYDLLSESRSAPRLSKSFDSYGTEFTNNFVPPEYRHVCDTFAQLSVMAKPAADIYALGGVILRGGNNGEYSMERCPELSNEKSSASHAN